MQLINRILDSFVGLSDSDELIDQMDVWLARLHALPAVCWLRDPDANSMFAVAAFGCEQPDWEWSPDAIPTERLSHVVLMHSKDHVVGALSVPSESPELEQLACVLGPILQLVQQQEHLFAELRQLHQQRHHLICAGNLLRYLDLDVLLVEIIQVLVQAIEAQVGAMVVVDETAEDGWRTAVSLGLRDDHIRDLRTLEGERWCDQVIASGKRVMLENSEAVQAACNLEQFDGVLDALLLLPLKNDEQCFGVAILANPELGQFDEETERLAKTVSDMAVIALTNVDLVAARVRSERMGRELDIASEVQERMLPTEPLLSGSVRISGVNHSCTETGGDYFTYGEFDGSVLVMIGDVTGHGIGAALFTTVAHSMAQQQFLQQNSLLEKLHSLNEGLYLARSGRFMTAAMLKIDPDFGHVTYYSAGHNPLLWISDGEPVWLESQGLPLGLLSEYAGDSEKSIQMQPGDSILLYTDGITEAQNEDEECFGEERLAEIVQRGVREGINGDTIQEWIMTAVRDWLGDLPSADDLTLTLIQFHPKNLPDTTGPLKAQDLAE